MAEEESDIRLSLQDQPAQSQRQGLSEIAGEIRSTEDNGINLLRSIYQATAPYYVALNKEAMDPSEGTTTEMTGPPWARHPRLKWTYGKDDQKRFLYADATLDVTRLNGHASPAHFKLVYLPIPSQPKEDEWDVKGKSKEKPKEQPKPYLVLDVDFREEKISKVKIKVDKNAFSSPLSYFAVCEEADSVKPELREFVEKLEYHAPEDSYKDNSTPKLTSFSLEFSLGEIPQAIMKQVLTSEHYFVDGYNHPSTTVEKHLTTTFANFDPKTNDFSHRNEYAAYRMDKHKLLKNNTNFPELAFETDGAIKIPGGYKMTATEFTSLLDSTLSFYPTASVVRPGV